MSGRRKSLLGVARSVGARLRLRSRERLAKTVRVPGPNGGYAYRVSSFEEYVRTISLASKEPGTVSWLVSELGAGDVFFDIGANMGIYTIPAAHLVGPAGAVYAFEPHVVNAGSLLENVRANGYDDRVRVFSCALHDRTGFFDFRYSELTPGSSMSQLEAERDAFGQRLVPVAHEVKFATTVDALLGEGALRPPALVKIDVDGNELLVLRGMRGLLGGAGRPRSVQVEVNVDERDELVEFMAECGFDLAERHYTEGGQRLLDAGEPPAAVPFNGIFRPGSIS